jgi:hypothetical protein
MTSSSISVCELEDMENVLDWTVQYCIVADLGTVGLIAVGSC